MEIISDGKYKGKSVNEAVNDTEYICGFMEGLRNTAAAEHYLLTRSMYLSRINRYNSKINNIIHENYEKYKLNSSYHACDYNPDPEPSFITGMRDSYKHPATELIEYIKNA